MDLSTNYMGLALRNPLVASPSPLSYTLDGIKRLADGGIGAIVMFSLFEEQLREEAARGRTLFLSIHQLTDAARVCDRLVLLSAGRVAGEGTLEELRERAGLSEGGLEEVFLALT